MKKRFVAPTALMVLAASNIVAPGWADELKIDFESPIYHETGLNGQDSWNDSSLIHTITTNGALAGKQSLQIAQPPRPSADADYAKSGHEYAIRKVHTGADVAQWSMLVKPTQAGQFHARFDAGNGASPNVAGVYLDTRPNVLRASDTSGERIGNSGDIMVGDTYRLTVSFDYDAQKYTVKVEGVGNPTSISATFPFTHANLTQEQASAGAILFRNVLLKDFDGTTLVDDITLGPKP
ncbi:MAG: hypothetical protein IT578_05090 [Verrucomicrobiae bacterium]|nr:hypothetical protein [Verrucomicrobiae bacterium]